MRILVAGSRTWQDYTRIVQHLNGYPRESTVIHGAAKGADQLAGTAAKQIGYLVEEYPADWRGKGRGAGFIRNLEMLDSKPDKVIAFWDGQSRGTAHTIEEARKRGIPVEVVLEHPGAAA